MAAFVLFKLQFTATEIANAARPIARAAGLVRLSREGKFQSVYDGSEAAIRVVSNRKPYLATLRSELGKSLTLKRTTSARATSRQSFFVLELHRRGLFQG
jgi:hypothetical protein